MTSMSDYRSWTTARVMPPKQDKPLERPKLSFAEQARMENRKVLASWDRTGCAYAGNREAIEARRLDWLDMLPEGPFGRIDARLALGIKDAAADTRIANLERAGLLKRLPVRPLQWVKA